MMTSSSIYKFVDFKDNYALENLKNREIICKCFDDYNDPYESHHGIVAQWPSAYKQADELRNLITRLEPDQADEHTESIEAMRAYINNKRHLRDQTRDEICQASKDFRVCSFTRRWNHILMWAHYADGCRGAVLVFDQREILEGDSARAKGSNKPVGAHHIPLQWVKYTTSPPVIDSVKVFEAVKTNSEELLEEVSRDIVGACILSKYKAWRYEQETRMVTRYELDVGKDAILYKYNEKALTGLILGNKLPEEQIVNIAKSVRPDVDIFSTKLVGPRYKLEIKQKCTASDITTGKVKI